MPNYVELPFGAGFQTYVVPGQEYGQSDHGGPNADLKKYPLDLYLYYSLDFHAPKNTAVFGQGHGKVIDRRDGNADGVSSNSGLGNYVTVQYYDATGHKTFVATYAHLEAGTVIGLNATVDIGTRIGASGASGGAYDPHLHVTYGQATLTWNGLLLADGSQAHNAGAPVSFVESATGILHSGVALVGDNGHPVAPHIVGFSPDTGVVGDGITSSKYVYVSGTAEANSTVLLYDGQSYVGQVNADSLGNFRIYAGGLSDGQHHFSTYDVDRLNYVSSASNTLNVTIDTTAPLSAISGASMKYGLDTVSGLVADTSVKAVALYDGGYFVGTVAVNNSSWSSSLFLNASTTHTLTAYATDAAGNTGKAVGAAIFGGTGADTIVSQGNDSFLFGGAGTGRDTFVFHANFGKDVVGDFHAGEDFIQFDRSLFASATSVLAHTANDGHGNSVITYDSADTVTLTGVTKEQLALHQWDIHLV